MHECGAGKQSSCLSSMAHRCLRLLFLAQVSSDPFFAQAGSGQWCRGCERQTGDGGVSSFFSQRNACLQTSLEGAERDGRRVGRVAMCALGARLT